MKQTKRAHERCVRTTISMPPALFDRAANRQKTRGYSAFSDYIQQLVREDSARDMAALNG